MLGGTHSAIIWKTKYRTDQPCCGKSALMFYLVGQYLGVIFMLLQFYTVSIIHNGNRFPIVHLSENLYVGPGRADVISETIHDQG